MNNAFYSSMLNGLSNVKLSGFERTQAELHMRRAAALVEMVLGSRSTPLRAQVEAPVAAAQPAEYRAAA